MAQLYFRCKSEYPKEARGRWARCLVEGHLVPLNESLNITNVYVHTSGEDMQKEQFVA